MKNSSKILIIWLIVYVVLGILFGLVEQLAHRANLLIALPTMVLVYLWCRADANERGLFVSSGLTMFATAVAFMGVPVYLWRTRNSLGAAAAATLKALLFYVAAMVLLMAATGITKAMQT